MPNERKNSNQKPKMASRAWPCTSKPMCCRGENVAEVTACSVVQQPGARQKQPRSKAPGKVDCRAAGCQPQMHMSGTKTHQCITVQEDKPTNDGPSALMTLAPHKHEPTTSRNSRPDSTGHSKTAQKAWTLPEQQGHPHAHKFCCFFPSSE